MEEDDATPHHSRHEGYNLRSRAQGLTSAERFTIWKQQQADNGTPFVSQNVSYLPRPVALQVGSTSRRSHASASVSSTKSHSSQIQRERLELETEEERIRLQEEEDAFRIESNRKQAERQADIEQEALKLKSIQRKQELLNKKEKFLKKLIDEEDEQRLSSDEERLETGGDVDPDPSRFEEYLRASSEQAEKGRLELEIKNGEEIETRMAKEQARREKFEKKKAELVQKLSEAKLQQAQRLEQQEKEKVEFEKASEEQIKIEKELESLKKTSETPSAVSVIIPPVASGNTVADQFAEAMVTALGRLVPNSAPQVDTSKFLARQSYSKDLPFFSGKPEEWPIFKADFDRSTLDCGFSNSENMSRLRKCLKGDAAKYVLSLMVSPDNVSTVMSQLEIRYGQPELIIQSMIEKAKGVSAFLDGDLESLIEFGSAVQNVVATIATLKRPEHMSNPQLLKEFEDKLPRTLVVKWLDYAEKESRKHDLTFFAQWLQKRTNTACKACPPQLTSPEKPKNYLHKSGRIEKYSKNVHFEESLPTAAGLFVGERINKQGATSFKKNSTPVNSWNPMSGSNEGSLGCIFCGKHSDSATCSQAKKKTLLEKMDICYAKRCCFICLKENHMAKQCRSPIVCVICGQRHAAAMCQQNSVPPPSTSPTSSQFQTSQGQQKADTSATNLQTVQIAHSNTAAPGGEILKTVMVTIVGERGMRKRVRALFDDGSQKTYVKKSVVAELGLFAEGQEGLFQQVFGNQCTSLQHHNVYDLKLENKVGNGYIYVTALDQSHICGKLPRAQPGPWIHELQRRNIQIGESDDDESEEIGLLIGAKDSVRLMTGQRVMLGKEFVAVQTRLGWTLQGHPDQCGNKSGNNSVLTVHSMVVANSSVEQLWDLETIGIRDPIRNSTKEEKEIETKKYFQKTVSRNEDGRYCVNLPWIDGKQKIPSNRNIAFKRLEKTTKDLRSVNMLEHYDKIFTDWCKEGIIEEVPEDELESVAHYIPHRAVFKPESLTIPIRPVFDASCKAPRTPSLNECLEKGPNLLELIPSILLRFREHKVGVISDIRKAFQMVEMKAEDRDSLRFLWWQDVEKSELKVYRHNRVVFGVNCSPFLLAAVLELHLMNVKEELKPMMDKLLRSLYVDNCVTSVATLEEAQIFQEISTQVMAEAKMELRQWEFSSVEELGTGSLSSRECRLSSGGELNSITSVLGYKWDKDCDTLSCDIDFEKWMDEEKLSKRSILSAVQKVYDPIGFACPTTLQPRILLQKLWAEKTTWDKEVASEFRQEFEKWMGELKFIQDIHVPRNMTGGIYGREGWQIHIFCDASKVAYAAIVFLRVESEGKVTVNLLQAKARVAPLDKPSIPRLELLGCTVAALLSNAVDKSLESHEVPHFFWTDSMTALAWLKSCDIWGTFVGNRVKTILSLTDVKDWRHVPGKSNPADLPSRGCSPSELLSSKWWEGPSWLKNSEEDWPTSSQNLDEEEVNKEKRKTVATCVVATEKGRSGTCLFPYTIKIYGLLPGCHDLLSL